MRPATRTTPANPTTLGDLAPLADIADRIDTDLRGDTRDPARPDAPTGQHPPPPCVIATADLAANPADLPDVVDAVPVLTAGPEPLAWAVGVAALLLDVDVAELVPDVIDDDGRLDHAAWATLCSSARDRTVELTEWASMPERLIDEVHDRQIQSALGFLRRTARTGRTVLIDGPVPAVAALILAAAEPGNAAHVVPLQLGCSILESRVWSQLGLEPVLPWRTRIHDGSLARLALAAVFTARDRRRGFSQMSPGTDPAGGRPG